MKFSLQLFQNEIVEEQKEIFTRKTWNPPHVIFLKQDCDRTRRNIYEKKQEILSVIILKQDRGKIMKIFIRKAWKSLFVMTLERDCGRKEKYLQGNMKVSL